MPNSENFGFGGAELDFAPPEVVNAANEAARAATSEGVRTRFADTLQTYRDLGEIPEEESIYSGVMITLEDTEASRQRALFNKLEEYYRRFDDGHNTNKCERLYPTDALRSVMHSTYKVITLHTLLLEGVIDMAKMEAALVATGPFDATRFESAFALLDSYVTTGGRGVTGGTGLLE